MDTDVENSIASTHVHMLNGPCMFACVCICACVCVCPLTDVVVLVSHVELVAQGEGAVALELLGELDGRVGGVRPVALPALEAQLRVAGAVAAVTDHVEHVLLGGAPLAGVVVRAVDVQVVINIHLHRVAFSPQTTDRCRDPTRLDIIK